MKAVGLCLALKGERSDGLLVLSLNNPLASSVRPPTGLISQVFADVFVQCQRPLLDHELRRRGDGLLCAPQDTQGPEKSRHTGRIY